MRNRLIFAITAALLAIVAGNGFVQATPGTGVTTIAIGSGRFLDIDTKP